MSDNQQKQASVKPLQWVRNENGVVIGLMMTNGIMYPVAKDENGKIIGVKKANGDIVRFNNNKTASQQKQSSEQTQQAPVGQPQKPLSSASEKAAPMSRAVAEQEPKTHNKDSDNPLAKIQNGINRISGKMLNGLKLWPYRFAMAVKEFSVAISRIMFVLYMYSHVSMYMWRWIPIRFRSLMIKPGAVLLWIAAVFHAVMGIIIVFFPNLLMLDAPVVRSESEKYTLKVGGIHNLNKECVIGIILATVGLLVLDPVNLLSLAGLILCYRGIQQTQQLKQWGGKIAKIVMIVLAISAWVNLITLYFSITRL